MAHPLAAKLDLFGGVQEDPFRWIVAIFAANGATQIIQKATSIPLKTYYPIRANKKGEYVALWSNYLFVEFQECTTMNLCRSTVSFIGIISARDIDSQIRRPVLIRRDAIQESMRLMRDGKFDEMEVKRRFYGRGSRVLVRGGSFMGRYVTVQIDIRPNLDGRVNIPVDIDGHKATIELFKLAL